MDMVNKSKDLETRQDMRDGELSEMQLMVLVQIG
jgi:hypothetical protein